ncbi:MAG: hypothetical protein GVY24_07380 [Planctomycetes bacterium]|nr:hypothetical protein [Planctomycetota bacterium]
MIERRGRGLAGERAQVNASFRRGLGWRFADGRAAAQRIAGQTHGDAHRRGAGRVNGQGLIRRPAPLDPALDLKIDLFGDGAVEPLDGGRLGLLGGAGRAGVERAPQRHGEHEAPGQHPPQRGGLGAGPASGRQGA